MTKREEHIRGLKNKFGIEQGARFEASGKQAWFLTEMEVVAYAVIERYLRPLKSCLITDIYALESLKIFWPNNNIRRYAVKYLLQLMWKFHLITVKCNGGYKVIAWNVSRERRKRRMRRKSRK